VRESLKRRSRAATAEGGCSTGEIKSRGKVTVAEIRDLFHTSRKYALALMEYLDTQKITRRVGDARVLR